MYICKFIDIYLKGNAGQKAKNRDFTLLTKLSYDEKKAFLKFKINFSGCIFNVNSKLLCD